LETAVKNIHEELIKGCRQNDRNAQIQVYKLYYKAMYNTALRIVNHTAEAEDIMQESFLHAFSKIGEYRGDASFGTWLKSIVVNKSVDAFRRAKNLIPIEDVDTNVTDTNSDEDHLGVLYSRVEDIRKAIHLLPDTHRVILSLHLLEGYDHEEISQILDISNNLSRTRYSRARQKLLEYLGKDQQSSAKRNS